jgi:hypothetical protein
MAKFKTHTPDHKTIHFHFPDEVASVNDFILFLDGMGFEPSEIEAIVKDCVVQSDDLFDDNELGGI